VHDLQGLLEPLEALRERREGDTETAVLSFVPGRSDTRAARPPESTSSVDTILARRPGWR
jgi:hypothetical protein